MLFILPRYDFSNPLKQLVISGDFNFKKEKGSSLGLPIIYVQCQEYFDLFWRYDFTEHSIVI